MNINHILQTVQTVAHKRTQRPQTGAPNGLAGAPNGLVVRTGVRAGSAGVEIGGSIQTPVYVAPDVTGNTVDVIKLLNPAFTG